ncbi:MAG: choice-of-anchor L domain-containing protein [Bacteroidota bacterium]
MRKFLTLFISFLIFSTTAFAQAPPNDDCLNAVVISNILDYCSAPGEFTNVNATQEAQYGIPSQCTPPWSGDGRDVWFQFTTPLTPNPIEVIITVNGNDGVNGTMVMPQIAVYRGDCSGFAELLCIQSPLNAVSQSLILDGPSSLDANENYWIRINDYSATGTPNAGTFQLCIDEYEPPTCMADGMTSSCIGTLFDSGCDTGDYSNNEDIVYTICPSDPHNCIFFDVSSYNIAGGDQLFVYDGPDTNSPISAILSGTGSSFQAQAATGCMTLQFISNGFTTGDGWEATWNCSFLECDNAPPPPPDFMACSGTFFDTGGAFLDYTNNANEIYTICPDSVFSCLTMNVINYSIETNDDLLFIYDGPDIGSPILTALTGVGSGLSFNSDDCITVQFVSDGFTTSGGWEIEWFCSADACPPDGSGFDFPDETTCTGDFFDSGGPANNYQNNELWDYSICPDDPHGCLVLTIDSYNIGNLDQLSIFGGLGFGGPVLAQLTGSGTNVEVQTDQGCITVQFASSIFSSSPGWSGSYTCTVDECQAPVPMTVTPNVPDSVMVETILSNFDVQTMNVMVNCPQGAYGVFQVSGGTSEIGMTEGIILTSGSAVEGIGPNDSGAETTINGAPGDPTLDQLAGAATNDACELIFEVYAPTDILSFDYVFASEEYPEWTCSNFNDPFAFFISGPGIVGEMNIALIPGTNTPVTINNLNGGNGGACPPTNAQYYVDGIGGITTEYDGFTTILTAMATVIPCNWYTLRLVVADAGDSSFDSAVFIEANSFEVGVASILPTYEFSPDLDAAVEGCAQGFFNVTLSEPSADTVVVALSFSGTAQNGIDFATVPDSVIFFPGDTVISIPINPIADNDPEGIEEAIIALEFQTICGAFEFDTANVVIQDNIFVDIAQDTLRICQGDSLQLLALGAIAYQWTPALNIIGENSPDPIVFPTESTTYHVTGALLGSFCMDTDSIYIEVVGPELDIPQDTLFICERDSVLLEATASGGGTVSWSPTEGLESPGSLTTEAYPTATTTYIASIGLDGCSAEDTVTVAIIPFPLMNLIPDTTICQTDTITLAANVEGFDYTWSPATGLSDPNSANPQAFPDQTTTYTVYLSNSFCLDSAQVTVNVNPLPFLEAGPDVGLCEGESVQLMALTNVGGNYLWEPSATLSNQFLPNPVATPLETTTYYVTFTDQGCPSVDSLTVTVGPPITGISTIPDTTICQGEAIVLGSTQTEPNVTYTWSPADGLDDPNSPNPTASPGTSTVYTLVATNGPCTENVQITVNVIPELVVDAGAGTNICIGESTQLNGSYSPLGGSFSWSPIDGLDDPNSLTPIATPTQTTTYTLSYQVLQCVSSAEVTIVVDEDVPLAVIDDETICIGESITLGSTVPTNGATYTWTPSDYLDDPNTANPVATPEFTTTYMLQAQNGACMDSAMVTISVIRDLEVDAGEDVTICDGDITTLIASGMNGTSFVWSPTDGLDDPNSATTNASPDTTTTYTVAYFEEDCFVEDQVTVTVAGTFSLSVSNDTMIWLGDEIMISADAIPDNNNDIGNITYEWTSTTGLSEPNSPETLAGPLQTITYTVTATSDAGCSATETVNIVVMDPTFGIPNAFSPNGDGLNDYFTVAFEGNIEIVEFKIWNRWGELVYNNDNNPTGWDGRYKGENMPVEVYVYYAIVRIPTGEETVFKGDVTLLR